MEKDRQKLRGLAVFTTVMGLYMIGIIMIQTYLVYWR